MPPPTIIPGAHSSRPIHHASDTPYSIVADPEPKADPRASTTNRIAPIKHAGFKPIGQTSSLLRRFFPGDDDDTDVPTAVQSQSTTSVGPRSQELSHEPQTSAMKIANRSATEDEEHHNNESYGRVQRVDEDPVGRHDLHDPRYHIPSSPPDQSRRSSLTDPAPLTESRNDELENNGVMSPPPQTHHRSDRDGNDATGASTPSMGSRGELYAIVSQVGEGTFGKVYKARNMVTKVHVALKRIRMESERDGFPVTAMREIKLLQSLRHENVVRLYEMMVSNGELGNLDECLI
jgi:hypothetical protein